MVKVLKIILLIIASTILQITLVARISVFGSRIDLPLALVIAMALLKGTTYGQFVGFASGLLCDMFSGGPIGLQALSKTIVGYSAGFLRIRFYSDSYITQLLSGFIATLVVRIITSAYLGLFADPEFLKFSVIGLILTGSLNSILVVGIYLLLMKFIKDSVKT